MLYSKEEIDAIKDVSERTNYAYATYASLWLDFVDYNFRHFFYRNIDINPIYELEDKGIEPTDETIYQAYVENAISIVRHSISDEHPFRLFL